MAPDEGRLLSQIFESVMAKEPHADQREAKALHLLCETCSENFALRFMREVLCRAAGLARPKLALAPDNCPSLRSISDGFYQCEVNPEEVSFEESDRMLLWLWSLLSLPLPEPTSSRLQQALRSLLPALRQRIFQQMATTRERSFEAASRASKLWRALQSEGMDDGADTFVSLCEVLDRGHGLETDPPGGLEKMEELLKKHQNKESALCGQRPASDSWTAVGTILDHETLNIVCREEHSDEVFLPANAKQTWLDWAATETDEAVDGELIDFSTEIPGHSSSVNSTEPPEVVEAPSEVATRREVASEASAHDSKPMGPMDVGHIPADLPDLPDLPDPAPPAESITAERFQTLAKELMKQVLQPWK
mmetsp:Transcript_62191/g.136187  ORF Transcript_62191/g.136187 Transcript_62191/m.136187 type:complete len:364 (+) Transcript_62191:2-1093(+)